MDKICEPDLVKRVEGNIGHKFTAPALLELALTHSSHANEQGCEGRHNERLEFLGDAVLGLCVAAELFKRMPDLREGRLTVERDRLVSEPVLADLAVKLGLDQALRLGKGEEKQCGRAKPSLLADAFEAVLAAVYLDGGYSAAENMVALVYAGLWPRESMADRQKDAKTRLQELCQKKWGGLPAYAAIRTGGPDHAPIYESRVILPDGREFCGQGTSAKKAGHAAAASALEDLQ